MSPPRVLTIAGSDSGGGAGIQADLKTFLSLGTYGLSVVTALTAQNTKGVSAIHAVPPEFVLQQLDAVCSDIEVDAIKIGMLCNEDIVKALAPRLSEWKQQQGRLGGQNVPIVLDPVMISTSGSLLLSETAVQTLITSLLPLCTLLTPNLPEARHLLKQAATSFSSGSTTAPTIFPEHGQIEIAQMMEAARQLASLGPEAVLVKGGHAQFTRRQITNWIDGLAPDFETETVEPLQLRPEVTDFQYPVRRDKTGQRHCVEPEDELRLLAGVMGASITRRDNVTIIRTDELPNARVLSYASGGASSPDDAVTCDVFYQKKAPSQDRMTISGSYILFIKPLVKANATHGTGCTLSSALAASLAQGHSLVRSTSLAINYVQQAIAGGIQDLGSGQGPLDHSFPFQARGLFVQGLDSDGKPHPHQSLPLCRTLISNSLAEWKSFVQHPFVLGLANDTLHKSAFLWFMKQDYIFLGHYARVWAQAATSLSNTFDEISQFAAMSQSMVSEAKLHLQLCKDSFGISREELEHRTMESAATLAYTRFVMEIGRSGDLLDLLVAVAPCMLGYAEVGLWLDEKTKERPVSSDYRVWIDAYSGQEFQTANQKAMALIEARAQRDPPSPVRLAALQKIWNAACRLETGMWDEAMQNTRHTLIVEPAASST